MFDKTKFCEKKIREWVKSEKEFVRRAGFVLMATSAVHDKEACDERFLAYLPIIEKYSTDERNFVKKAVNWALRQIGKRNSKLRKEALKVATRLKIGNSTQGSEAPGGPLSESSGKWKLITENRASRWIGADAVRELTRNKLEKQFLK